MGLPYFLVMGWLSDLMIFAHVCIKCNHYVILSLRLLRIVESISLNDTGLVGLRCLSIPKSADAGICLVVMRTWPSSMGVKTILSEVLTLRNSLIFFGIVTWPLLVTVLFNIFSQICFLRSASHNSLPIRKDIIVPNYC